MNLSIRNDVPNFRSAKSLQEAAASPVLHSARANTTAPPDGAADPALTAQIQSKMKDQFAAKAADPRAFHDLMAQVYGKGYDQEKAEGLRQKALVGDFSWLPPVRLLDAKTLHGANGAYDAQNGVVYINADIAAKDPDLAAATYVEEAGAHLDVMLNTVDAAGDEGEMLRRLMGGEKLSQQEVAEIRAENDHGTITVDGKQVNVEFWNPLKSIGNAVKKAAKGVGSAVKSAASHAWNAVKSTGSALKDAGAKAWSSLQDAGGVLMGGLGKMTIDFGKNLIQGKVGEAFKSLFEGAGDIVIGMPKKIIRTGIDLVRDTANSVTHLLPEVIGSRVRKGITKAVNFVGDFTDAFLDKTRAFGGMFTGTVTDLFQGLENAVRMGIDGDFSGAVKAFGGAFKDLPGNFWDRAMNLFSPAPPAEPEVA